MTLEQGRFSVPFLHTSFINVTGKLSYLWRGVAIHFNVVFAFSVKKEKEMWIKCDGDRWDMETARGRRWGRKGC